MIRIVLDNKLSLPLRAAFARAVDAYATQRSMKVDTKAVQSDLLAFIADRLKVYLREKGIRHDLIAAVFALTGEDDLVRLIARVEALQGFLAGEYIY